MDVSPFGTLPPELRNRIYEYFFHSQLTRQVHIDIRGERPILKRHQNKTRSALALAATCRQIRHETLAIFWSTASFRVVADTLTAFSVKLNDIEGVVPLNRANHINQERLETLEEWLQHSGIANFARFLRPIELDLGMWDPRMHADVNPHIVLRLMEGNTKSVTHLLQSIDDYATSTIAFPDQVATQCTLLFKVQVQPSTALGSIQVPNKRKQALAKIEKLFRSRSAGVQAMFDEGRLTPHCHFVLSSDVAMCRSVAGLLVRYIVQEEKEIEGHGIRSPAGNRGQTSAGRKARKGRQ